MVEPRHSAFTLNTAEYDSLLTERYRVAIALVCAAPPRSSTQVLPRPAPPQATRSDARRQVTFAAWERARRLTSGTAHLLSTTQARLARPGSPAA